MERRQFEALELNRCVSLCEAVFCKVKVIPKRKPSGLAINAKTLPSAVYAGFLAWGSRSLLMRHLVAIASLPRPHRKEAGLSNCTRTTHIRLSAALSGSNSHCDRWTHSSFMTAFEHPQGGARNGNLEKLGPKNLKRKTFDDQIPSPEMGKSDLLRNAIRTVQILSYLQNFDFYVQRILINNFGNLFKHIFLF